MQLQTAQLTLREVCDRLDRLPTSWFHAKILVVAGLSLLFDVLDTAVTVLFSRHFVPCGISM
jgi:putative MFS transporter